MNPKNILVINAGSSSIKYALYQFQGNATEIISGIIERIGVKGSPVKNYTQAFTILFQKLSKVLPLEQIDAVGHRIVHGGNIFYNPTLLTKKIVKHLATFNELAPLHNPYNLQGIEICMKKLSCPQVGVFDTGFHHNLPDKAKIYAIPYKYTSKDKIRRFGFHGISHEYVAQEAASLLHSPLQKIKMITCHLGNGSSLAAIDKGTSVDTSMGFTPLEGLVMGTRCGDIDPDIVAYLMQKEKLSRVEVFQLLEKNSGLKGICGYSDMRDILDRMKHGNKKCALAFHMFCYRIAKYLGAYLAVLKGVDAIVFTAGIGEHAPAVRHEVMSHFSFLGIALDHKKNMRNGLVISSSDSSIPIFVIPTNEALLIANKVHEIIKSQ